MTTDRTPLHTTGEVHVWGRRPTGASRMLQPRHPAFWILCAFFVFSIVFAVPAWISAFSEGRLAVNLGAAALWLLWLVVIAWLIDKIDYFSAMPTTTRLAALAWGVIVVPVMVVPLVSLMNGWLEPLTGEHTESYATAVPHEAVKLLGVVLLAGIAPVLFRRPMAALVSALLLASGFTAVVEWQGTADRANALADGGASAGTVVRDMAGDVFVQGVLAMPWAHMAFTAIAAMGVSWWMMEKEKSALSRLGMGALLFVTASALHWLTEMVTAIPLNESILARMYIAIGSLVIIGGLIAYSLREERTWFEHVADRTHTGMDPRAFETPFERHRNPEWNEMDHKAAKETQRAVLGYAEAVGDEDEQAAERLRKEALRKKFAARQKTPH